MREHNVREAGFKVPAPAQVQLATTEQPHEHGLPQSHRKQTKSVVMGLKGPIKASEESIVVILSYVVGRRRQRVKRRASKWQREE